MAEEELKLGVSALSIDYRKNSTNTETFREFVTSDSGIEKLKQAMGLEDDYVDLTASNGKITYKQVKYTVDDYGNVREYVSKIPNELKIGSNVTYNPNITTSSKTGTTTHTSIWEASLCSSTQTSDRTLNITGNGNDNMAITSWKVLSINEETETIELISAEPTTNTVYLGQAQGYNNAVFLLNKTCDELYGGAITKNSISYTIKGRNACIKDIEDRMTDDKLNNAIDAAHKYSDSDAVYGEQKDSEYANGYYPLIYSQELNSVINGNINTKSISLNLWNQTTPIGKTDSVLEVQSDGTTIITKESRNGYVVDGRVQSTTNIQPYQTSWYKANSFMQGAFKASEGLNEIDETQNTNYNLFFPNGEHTLSYWLASRSTDLYTRRCDFRVGAVKWGSLGNRYMFGSDGDTSSDDNSLRPIVSLNVALLSTDGLNFKIEP